MIGGRVRVRKPFTAEDAEGHGSVGARARGRMGAWARGRMGAWVQGIASCSCSCSCSKRGTGVPPVFFCDAGILPVIKT
jgi:hypothetical protein